MQAADQDSMNGCELVHSTAWSHTGYGT